MDTYQVATEPFDEKRAKSLLPRNCYVTDNQFVLNHSRLTPDHRLLFGGGYTCLDGMPGDIRTVARPYLEQMFLQSRGAALEYAWGGHIDCSMRRTPDIGRQGNRYWLQGYSGRSVLPSLMVAGVISDVLLGENEILALYRRLHNPKFPSGQRFTALLEASGKAYYRLRDLF